MPEIVEIEVRYPGEPEIALIEAGFRGLPGVGGAQISPAAANRLEAKPDGLFVGPPQYSSTQW